jgi:F0F1-type ATP synthase membrane subunit b/b'
VSPSLTTFLFEAANFVALAAVLGWVFFRPVQAAIERRRGSLEAERREADRMRADAERRLAEVETRRREIEVGLEPLRTEARREAERQAAAIVEAARQQAGEERARLEHELAALRREHARTLARDAAAAARILVTRLLAEIGGPDVDTALARAACERLAALPEAKRAGSVEVQTARPLDAETRARFQEVAGPAATVKDRVVPELGAGVRVITPAGLVDASASGLAAWAEQELVARILPDEKSGG